MPAPGLPFSVVFRVDFGSEAVLLKVASAYEAASQRRVPPPGSFSRNRPALGRWGCTLGIYG